MSSRVQFRPAHLHFPGAHPQRVVRAYRSDSRSQSPFLSRRRLDRQLAGIVERVKRDLVAVLVDLLAEIALLIQQPDADDRHAQVVRRLELIAGHVAQPARINRQRLAEHVLHAEIRDRLERRIRVGLLEPVVFSFSFCWAWANSFSMP